MTLTGFEQKFTYEDSKKPTLMVQLIRRTSAFYGQATKAQVAHIQATQSRRGCISQGVIRKATWV